MWTGMVECWTIQYMYVQCGEGWKGTGPASSSAFAPHLLGCMYSLRIEDTRITSSRLELSLTLDYTFLPLLPPASYSQRGEHHQQRTHDQRPADLTAAPRRQTARRRTRSRVTTTCTCNTAPYHRAAYTLQHAFTQSTTIPGTQPARSIIVLTTPMS